MDPGPPRPESVPPGARWHPREHREVTHVRRGGVDHPQPPQHGAANASAAAKTLAVGAAGAAAGLGVYAYLTHQTYVGAAKTLWRKAAKHLPRMPRVPFGG